VGLVDHDHRVTGKQRVDQSLPDEEAISEKLDASILRGDIFETYRVADLLANFAPKFFSDPDGYRRGRNTAGLIARENALLALSSSLFYGYHGHAPG
jgi:hypothetical protein